MQLMCVMVGPMLMTCLRIGEYMVNSLMDQLKLIQVNCLKPWVKTNIALLSLWVWVEVEGFKDSWICIP